MENRIVSAGSRAEALARIPDPRSSRGRRHPLPALRTLATVAMPAGARSLEALALIHAKDDF